MSNPILIELREDTADDTIQGVKNAGEYQVTLNNPIVLRNNDELSLSSVFVDSVATNSGKIVIEEDEQDFSVRNFLYVNNYANDSSLMTPFQRDTTPATTIVKGLNDGFDYVACANTGTKNVTAELITQITLDLTPHEARGSQQKPMSLHFKYIAVDGTTPMKFVINISKEINFKRELLRAGHNSQGTPNQAFYNMDDFKIDFGSLPSGFPLDCSPGTFAADTPFMVTSSSKKKFNGFTGAFSTITQTNTFSSLKLSPFIFTYNFTIPAGAYDPSEFARLLTDKFSNQNITSTDNVDYTDDVDDSNNKYLTSPFSFSSPYLKAGVTLAGINAVNDDIYACRFDGEGIIKSESDSLLFGSTQVGIEFDDTGQDKFFFSQIHSPYYIISGGVASMGTEFTNVVDAGAQATTNNFVANKTGGIGFVELKPTSVWFKKLGFDPSIITNFGVRDFDGNGKQTANYKSFVGNVDLLDLSPITFTLNDGVNTTGNFTSLDSAVDKQTPRVLPPDLGKLKDTSQIIKQIYAATSINDGGSLPYYLIEIEGKGVKSDIRGGVGSAIQNNKISAIVSRYYQTLSYTSSMDGSGAIPYIHTGEPMIIDSFKVRILDPDGTLTDNIQDSNVVFLQHTAANQ